MCVFDDQVVLVWGSTAQRPMTVKEIHLQVLEEWSYMQRDMWASSKGSGWSTQAKGMSRSHGVFERH